MKLATPALLLPLLAMPAAAAPTGSFSVDYDGLSHGLLALKMSGALTLTAGGYAGRLTYHTAGMIGWMVRNEDASQVHGSFAGDAVRPAAFDSVGNLRGTARTTRLTYAADKPAVLERTPPVEQERAPVPDADTAHTIDTLSAIALLIHKVATTGRCDGSAMLYDGRRLTALTARTVGDETVQGIARAKWSGQALRCDFEGNQIAGFKKGESEAAQRRTRHGTAWLAQAVPGGPPVPVRVTFENPTLGLVTLYMTAVSGAPGALAEGAPSSRLQ